MQTLRALQHRPRIFQGLGASLTTKSVATPRRPWAVARKWAWRLVWVPSAVLATIPATLTGLAAYHALVARDRGLARGYGFYALTSWLAIPTGAAICLAAPVSYLSGDWEHRHLLNWLVTLWARATTAPFFTPEFEGIENLPPPGRAAIYVSNHQSFMDIYTLWNLDAPLRFVARSGIKNIVIAGWLLETCGTGAGTASTLTSTMWRRALCCESREQGERSGCNAALQVYLLSSWY